MSKSLFTNDDIHIRYDQGVIDIYEWSKNFQMSLYAGHFGKYSDNTLIREHASPLVERIVRILDIWKNTNSSLNPIDFLDKCLSSNVVNT